MVKSIVFNGIYVYKGNDYQVVNIGKMKKDSGWVGAVIYSDIKGNLFVRELVDFANKFDSQDRNEW